MSPHEHVEPPTEGTPPWPIRTIDDLRVLGATRPGGGERRWAVTHSKDDYWHDCRKLGEGYFNEIERLASANEVEAARALTWILNSSSWDSRRGWGEETAFMRRLFEAAIVGLRAIRGGAERCDFWLDQARETERTEAAERQEREAAKAARRSRNNAKGKKK